MKIALKIAGSLLSAVPYIFDGILSGFDSDNTIYILLIWTPFAIMLNWTLWIYKPK